MDLVVLYQRALLAERMLPAFCAVSTLATLGVAGNLAAGSWVVAVLCAGVALCSARDAWDARRRIRDFERAIAPAPERRPGITPYR